MLLLSSAILLALAPGPRVEDPAPPSLSVEPVESPAGPGSLWPHLAAGGGGRVLLAWTEPRDAGGHALRCAERGAEGWTAPVELAAGEGWFVNWADFPAVAPLGEERLVGTWLERLGEGSYSYGVRVAAHPAAEGAAPRFLHTDRSEAEHGFVSLAPLADGRVAASWLDGRNTPAGPMALYAGVLEADGAPESEVELDPRVCDCCQTACVALADGSLVVAYRDRSAEEVRDIAVVRGDPARPGSWSAPEVVRRDGWNIPGCPVNGPALAARGDAVHLAWFTMGARNEPRVWLATSEDGGRTFGEAVRVDAGNPAGNVDVALLPDGSPVVTWLERRGERHAWRARVVPAGGAAGEAVELGPASGPRQAGFLRTAPAAGGILAAWRDVESGVRLARLVLADG